MYKLYNNQAGRRASSKQCLLAFKWHYMANTNNNDFVGGNCLLLELGGCDLCGFIVICSKQTNNIGIPFGRFFAYIVVTPKHIQKLYLKML